VYASRNGRDWYDVIWFIRRDIPLKLTYFTTCMHELNNWNRKEAIDAQKVIEISCNRIDELDIESAKEDVIPFLKNPVIVDEWSKDYLKHWINQLQFC